MADDQKSLLYRRITALPPEILLNRMRIHGFWPAFQGLPPDPPVEVAERDQLEKELSDLRKQFSTTKDPEKALAEERKRRWEESKERRKQRKAQRLAEHKQWIEQWEQVKDATLTHLGTGVSAGLAHNLSDTAALQARGLPVLHDGAQLAAAMGIELSTLRWLTFHRRGATLVHYRRYEIAKKTGKMRCISAPKPVLNDAQHWVLENILGRLPVEPQAQGFTPGRSIVTNAQPHVARAVVINLDLKDFFPSITFRRVKGLFHQMGYSEQIATVLALLCTEPPRIPAAVAGVKYYIALGQRVLPQGACTSPAITNILCRKLDRRLAGLASKLGFAYTRYADDLTFSACDDAKVAWLLKSVRAILAEEGFEENLTKTRIMRRSRRQEVTGVTVNARTTLSRRERRDLRAILHNAARLGLQSQNRENHPNFAAYLRGRVAFLCMVDPGRATEWQLLLEEALANP